MKRGAGLLVFALIVLPMFVFGISGVYAYSAGFGHDPNDIDWSKTITGTVRATNFCIGASGTNCLSTVGSGAGPGVWDISVNGQDVYYDGGKVGIGTNAPAYSLHINTAAIEPLFMRNNNGWLRIGLTTPSSGYKTIFETNQSSFYFTRQGGIVDLNVQGNINATGKICAGTGTSKACIGEASADTGSSLILSGELQVGTGVPTNLGEDIYGAWTSPVQSGTDTCDGSMVEYVCPANNASSCVDYNYTGAYRKRDVQCKLGMTGTTTIGANADVYLGGQIIGRDIVWDGSVGFMLKEGATASTSCVFGTYAGAISVTGEVKKENGRVYVKVSTSTKTCNYAGSPLWPCCASDATGSYTHSHIDTGWVEGLSTSIAAPTASCGVSRVVSVNVSSEGVFVSGSSDVGSTLLYLVPGGYSTSCSSSSKWK